MRKMCESSYDDRVLCIEAGRDTLLYLQTQISHIDPVSLEHLVWETMDIISAYRYFSGQFGIAMYPKVDKLYRECESIKDTILNQITNVECAV